MAKRRNMAPSKQSTKSKKGVDAETGRPSTATLISKYLLELQKAGIELEVSSNKNGEKERRI